MALGLNFGGGGDITPYIKYDARAGRISRADRKQGSDGMYASEIIDITASFKAVFDMENIEVGWIKFAAGAAPESELAPLGSPKPEKPADDWKQAVRFMLKLHASCAGDTPVRECTSNASSFLRGFDELHTAYLAGVNENVGKLPIVALITARAVTTGQGAKKSTNYQPEFNIVGWAPRPADLVFVPKAAGRQPAPVATAQPPDLVLTRATVAEHAAPPITGSTPVGPPPAARAAPQPAVADASDFG